jgi:hypothetical protein
MGWQPAILTYKILAAELGKSRQVGWQPAILKSRLLAAELGKSRQVWVSRLATRNPEIQAIGS